MRRIQFLFCLIILLTGASQFTQAQLVNVENMRLTNCADKAWCGSAGLQFSLVKNTQSLISLGSNIQAQYKHKKSLWLVVNNFSLSRAAKENLINSGFLHFRYNYKWKWWLRPEIFVQGQYNQIQLITFRGLAGVGPRFRLIKSDSVRLYVGTLYMFDYERVTNQDHPNIDHRLSSYLSVNYTFRKRVMLQQTTYFQPKFIDPRDFRVLTESSVSFLITNIISFNVSFSLSYDSRPAEDVVRTMYALVNQLTFTLGSKN